MQLAVAGRPQPFEHPVVVNRSLGRCRNQAGWVISGDRQAEFRRTGLDSAAVWRQDHSALYGVPLAEVVVEPLVPAVATRVVDALDQGRVGVERGVRRVAVGGR